MSLTESTMMPLGTPAPDFLLRATDDSQVSLNTFEGAKALVVIFICNHCPYVIHISKALTRVSEKYQAQGVAFVAINSNDVEAYPADSFENMKKEKALRGYPFPYVWDEDQSVARAYDAACTPDLYVFDAGRKLAYRGQFDDTRPRRISSGNYDSAFGESDGATLSSVLDTLLAGEALPATQYPSMGCNIKWRDS